MPDFIEANTTIDAVAAVTRHGKEGGAVFILTDNRTFELSAMDVVSLPDGFPRWVGGVENYI